MEGKLLITAGLELINTIIRVISELARVTGMSEEEIKKAFAEEKAKFLDNDPSKLPDV